MAFQQGSGPIPQSSRKRRIIPNRVQRGVFIPQQDNDFFNAVTDEVKFSTGEHRVVLAQEILGYIRNKETQKFLQNQCASRVLDNLVPFVNQNHLEFLGNMMVKKADIFFRDMYASFLVQNVLRTCLLRSSQRFKPADDLSELVLMPRATYNFNTIFGSAHIQFCGDFLMRSASYVKTNVADLVVHNYGTHVIRTVLSCLVGLDHVTEEAETRGLISYQDRLVRMRKVCITPKAWLDTFYELVDAVAALPNFPQLADDWKLFGVLQCNIKCLAAVGDTDRIAKFTDVFFGYTPETKEERFKVIFGNQPRLNFLESVMAALAPLHEVFQTFIESLFVSRFKELALDKQMKFPARHAVEHCQDKALFDTIFAELIGYLDDLWTSGNMDVIIEFAKACGKRFVDKQTELEEALLKTLRCPDSESLFYPVLKLQKFDSLDKAPLMIREQGAELFQQLLFFTNTCKPLVDKLIELPKPELMKILFDKSGTNIFYTLFHHTRFSKDQQEWFMRELTGRYAEMACSKFSEKTFMAIYETASPAYQVLIVYELAQRNADLKNSHSGRVIAGKLAVGAFAAGMQAWQKSRDEQAEAQTAQPDVDSGGEDGETWKNF